MKTKKTKHSILQILVESFLDLFTRWKRTALCYAFEIFLLMIIVFSIMSYYQPIDQSVVTIKEILDDSNNRDVTSLQKLSSREAELKVLQQSITDYVWNFLMIMISGFIIVSAATYSLLSEKFNIKRTVFFAAVFLLIQMLLFLIFGVILDIKTQILSNIWVSERTFMASSAFLIIVFLGNFMAATLCMISMKQSEIRYDGDWIITVTMSWLSEMKRNGLKTLSIYLILNLVSIAIFLFAFITLAIPFSMLGFLISLLTVLVILPLWRIMSKKILIRFMTSSD